MRSLSVSVKPEYIDSIEIVSIWWLLDIPLGRVVGPFHEQVSFSQPVSFHESNE